MPRKLSTMTTPQFKEELSIAGNPDKIMTMRDEILTIIGRVNDKNAAELINLEFLMRRLTAETKTWIRLYEQRTNQKII